MARFGVASLVARWLGERLGETLPFGTILVNITGCFLIGLVAGIEDPGLGWINRPPGRPFRLPRGGGRVPHRFPQRMRPDRDPGSRQFDLEVL